MEIAADVKYRYASIGDTVITLDYICYGLNVSPKFLCSNSNPNSIWKLAF